MEHALKDILTEDQKIDREIQLLCAVVAMRVREEMESTYEGMLAERDYERRRRCARQRAW